MELLGPDPLEERTEHAERRERFSDRAMSRALELMAAAQERLLRSQELLEPPVSPNTVSGMTPSDTS